ncbi:MAG: hypothetical protein AAF958_03315 [Planctomycetota bacterium]
MHDSVPRSLSYRTRLILLIAFCCVGFLVADLLTPWCFESPVLAMLALGIVTAQLTVICIWGTLVRGTFWIRLPWTFLLLMLSWCALAAGTAFSGSRTDPDDLLGIGLIWILGFITSFIPLKIAALCFRWQFVQVADESASGHDTAYTIRDIMIGTFLLALSMLVGRFLLLGQEVSLSRALRSTPLYDLQFTMVLMIYGVVSLLIKLPCIWIGLAEAREMIRTRVLQWFVYCFALVIFEFLLLIALVGPPGPSGGEVFFGLILGHLSMGGIMLGLCFALRGLGYRLERAGGVI